MCYWCYLYYEANNPNVLHDFEQGLITKVEKKSNPCIKCDGVKILLTINNQYIYLSCGCSNGYKFDDNRKVECYKKLYYNRKYHLEKYIKNIKIMKTLIELK